MYAVSYVKMKKIPLRTHPPSTKTFDHNQKNQLKIYTLEVRHAFESQTSN